MVLIRWYCVYIIIPSVVPVLRTLKSFTLFSQLRWIYLDVNGQLTKKCFTNFTALKTCLRHYFFFLRTSTNERCTRFAEPTGLFRLEKRWSRSATRGPRILFELVRTHFLARCVQFHFSLFSSSVYIPSRLVLSHATLFPELNWAKPKYSVICIKTKACNESWV